MAQSDRRSGNPRRPAQRMGPVPGRMQHGIRPPVIKAPPHIKALGGRGREAGGGAGQCSSLSHHNVGNEHGNMEAVLYCAYKQPSVVLMPQPRVCLASCPSLPTSTRITLVHRARPTTPHPSRLLLSCRSLRRRLEGQGIRLYSK